MQAQLTTQLYKYAGVKGLTFLSTPSTDEKKLIGKYRWVGDKQEMLDSARIFFSNEAMPITGFYLVHEQDAFDYLLSTLFRAI